MIEDFILFSFNVVLKLTFVIINIIMIPIDTAIQVWIPSLSQALADIATYFALITQYLGFAIELTGIPIQAIVLLASYYIFKLTVPLYFWTMKLGLKWYTTFKR